MTTYKTPALVRNPIEEEVLQGLGASPKRLPPKLFYDDLGSQLFERITRLPEYYPTRTERAIFQARAGEIVRQAGSDLTLVELGAGSASKTRILIEAVCRKQLRVEFYPVDVSSAALREAVSSLHGQFPNLHVQPVIADYSRRLPPLGSGKGRTLALFIGSSLGNFEPEEAVRFLARLRDALRPGDALLLGLDLVKKAGLLHDAYNDAQGITAQFNKNILARVNRELGGMFDLEAFRHVAFWNPDMSRIEMHLESRWEQTVLIRDLETSFHFAAGERIHTENSYKFTPESARRLLHQSGFCLENIWTDPQRWFCVALARV